MSPQETPVRADAGVCVGATMQHFVGHVHADEARRVGDGDGLFDEQMHGDFLTIRGPKNQERVNPERESEVG